MKVRGKIAVVTGASRGIGAAVSFELASRGAKVVLVARTRDDLAKVCNRIKEQGGKARFYAIDLSDSRATEDVCRTIKRDCGNPDILVNNAGLGRWLAIDETSFEEAEMMARIPYLAAFHLSREFIPAMLEKRSGSILCVNSPASLIAIPGAAAYSASRWALRGLAESLKEDLRGTGIRVCHCVLGEVSSNYFRANPGSRERIPKIASMTMPTLTPEQAAKIIVRAIERGKSEVTKPFMLAFYRFMLAVFPWIVKALVRATGWKRDG